MGCPPFGEEVGENSVGEYAGLVGLCCTSDSWPARSPGLYLGDVGEYAGLGGLYAGLVGLYLGLVGDSFRLVGEYAGLVGEY